jgi:hypothetical protein
MPRVKQLFYIYSPGAMVFAGATTLPFFFTIDTDADFIVRYLTGSATTIADFLIQVEDSYTSAKWFRSPIPAVGLLGTGQLPYVVAAMRRLPRNHQVTVTVTKTTAGADTLYMHFHGFKLFPQGAGAPGVAGRKG